ncbi:hypothetical protein [Haloarchaeobius baliensis]|uniref:hypothetical protein n=1 Tax=Haloarchaeobius baliensis TaxID=1670458 RepID=UPI003F883963
MRNRRTYLKSLGGITLGTAALGTAAVSSASAASTYADDSTEGTWHSGWQSYDAYNELDNQSATFEENLTYSFSPAQPAPFGEWSVYLSALSTTVCTYDDTDDLAPLVGYKKTKFNWRESQDQHVEYPESGNDDWIGGHNHDENDDLFWETVEFGVDTAEYVISLADEVVPDPVGPLLDTKNYIQEAVEFADDIGGWWDNWNSASYEWRDHNRALHTSFVMIELDQLEPGASIEIDMETFANQRRNPPEAGGAGIGWQRRSNLSNTLTAPDYESPDPT